MRKNTNTVNTASKDVLAKAMAMEGIAVQHDANAETAWFNVESRTLCLPVWEDMSNDVYDMLVGHEVSHALHTPVDGWKSWIGEDQHSGVRHQFLNIVEDARIERLIKSKFPGLKRNFARAYKQFNDKDMFEIKGDNLAERELIDRLNIEFKLGLYGHVDVQFSADEQQFVDRMHKTETIEDVQELAQDLFERWLSEQPVDENQKSESEMGEGGDDQDNESPQGAQGDEQGQDDSADSSGDTDGSGDESSDDNSQDGEGQGQNGEDSGQSMTDNTDDGESADSSEGDSTSNGEQQSSLGYDDYHNDPCSAGSTQRAFDKAVQSMRNENAGEYKYYTLPKMNVDNVIVGYKDIIAKFNEFNAENNDIISSGTGHVDCINDCNEFVRKSRPTVNHMVQRFMMKQSAEAMKKTEITKTGILDTTSMINYRWSEDIFLKNETHDDGKSHGIVMFLDWSGSMSDIIRETIEQLIINVEFCKKMQIPFEVYAFSSNRLNHEKPLYTSRGGNNELKPHGFCLFNFLSSKMNNREYKQSIENLWLLGESNTWKRKHYVRTPNTFGLGCTPLNEAIITAYEIVPAFQQENGVQIVNTVFLTDGDGHSMGASRGWDYKNNKSYIVDPKTRQNIEVGGNHAGETSSYLQILKNQTGCNIIGIRLSTQRSVDSMKYRYFNNEGGFDQQALEDASKSYKTNNFFSVKNCEGCDELFVIKGNVKVVTDAMEGLSDDASLAKIRNAFVKGNNKKKSSRVIANRIVDLIAV